MKLITGLGIILFFVILSVPVLAENTATSSAATTVRPQNIKDIREVKVEKIKKAELENGEVREAMETKIERLESKRKESVVKVRNSIAIRYGVYEKLIERSGNLLTKLQEKVDVAQKAGLNTKVVDGYMTDAKTKLEGAKLTLDSIKTLQGTAIDKKAFQNIQKKFIIIHKDLNTVKLDGAKVVAELKRFNAVTPKPTKEATTSAGKP